MANRSARRGHSFKRKAAPLRVVYQPVDALRPNPKNPRVHPRRQVLAIAHSIETFGCNVPLLVRANGELVAGYGRWLAAKELGLREVPTIRLEHLTEAQIRAFIIADNRLTEIATWDEQLLTEQLKELSELELDFSLEASGFTMAEIDLRIGGLGQAEEDQADPADAPPELPPGPPVTRAGDLWLLDRHRVYCGNALERAAYRTLMQGEKASMVFTDPPYNMPIAGHASGLGRTRHGDFVMASGEMTEPEFTDFLTEACSLLARHSMAGSLHFVCMDWRHMGELLTAGREAYGALKNVCVWVKGNAGMGSLYRSQHELIFVFKHGKAAHRNNVQLGQYGRHRSNVWHYPNISAFGRGGEEGNLSALHPTVKPVALVADAMLDASARGDVVLDAFMGSGSTLIAAERMRRRCFGLELEPLYVDVIVRRWQTFTGDQARHAVTGCSFDDTAAESKALHAG